MRYRADLQLGVWYYLDGLGNGRGWCFSPYFTFLNPIFDDIDTDEIIHGLMSF
jgi:hypothetical protein